MADRIAGLLQTVRGDQFLKKLFWELLGFDRVNEPIPYALLSQAQRNGIAECHILARFDLMYVCHLRLLVSELTNGIAEPFLDRIGRAWPSVLTVFSTYDGSEMDFCWRNGLAAQSRTHRLLLDEQVEGLGGLARFLSRLATYDPRTGNDYGPLHVSTKADQAFTALPRRRRERRYADPLVRFFNQVTRWKLLSWEEEQDLALRWQVDRDLGARATLICSNVRLVISFARDFRRRGLEFDDLIQVGCVGLIEAVERFDPTVGARLSTYAGYWIEQALTRAVRHDPYLVAIPDYLLDVFVKWKRSKQDGAGTVGFVGKLPDHLSMPAKLASRMRFVETALRSAWWRRKNEICLAELVTQNREDTPSNGVRAEQLHEMVEAAFAALPPRHVLILRERFGLGSSPRQMTLQKIGERVGLTRERVRQIVYETIDTLAQRLEPYLEGL